MRLSRARLRRLERLEAELARSRAEHRLAVALQAAGEVFSASGVAPPERDEAVGRVVLRLPADWQHRPELAEDVADALAEELATDARREAVRRAVEELATDLRDRLPQLAAELERALAEPVLRERPQA